MIRIVHEIDPLLCPEGGGRMRIFLFIEDLRAIKICSSN